MAAFRYILPALAAASGAAAQCSGTTTIQSAGDATALAGACGSKTFSGDVVIATDAANAIALDTITGISGSLIADGAVNLTGLSGDSLQTIGKSFTLKSLTQLTDLAFPDLTAANDIEWQTLPVLQALTFDSGISKASTVSIVDTMLGALTGINLKTADTVMINSNRYLSDITMQLSNVVTSLTVGLSAATLECSFPNLIWANSMTFRNVSSVSIPSLQTVNDSLGFYSASFSSLAAPNLTTVGDGGLAFVACGSLSNISMPELTMVGGAFQLANNTELTNITGFPLVASVGGAIDFNGVSIVDVELPALNDVRGGFNLQSTKNIDDICNHFESISGPDNKIQGNFTCTTTATPEGSDGTPDGTSSSGASATSTGAAHPMLIPGATGVLGVVFAIFGML